MKTAAFCALVLVGCGGDGGGGNQDAATSDGTSDSPEIDGATNGFMLTSPSLAAGGEIDAAFTCAGADTSPQLDWVNPPAGALGFAVELVDMSLTPPLIHWVIYDLAASVTGLPANVEKAYAPANVSGAHQTPSYNSSVRGYMGPCPPNKHTYEFRVYALDVAPPLPGAVMSTTRAAADSTIQMHSLGMAKLVGTYTP